MKRANRAWPGWLVAMAFLATTPVSAAPLLLQPIVIDTLPFTFTFQPFPATSIDIPDDPQSCTIFAHPIAPGPHLECQFVNDSGEAIRRLDFDWIAPPDVWNFLPFVNDGGPWFSREQVAWFGATFRDGQIASGGPPFAVDLAGFRPGMTITLTAVPEPAVSTLLVLGVAAWAAQRRVRC